MNESFRSEDVKRENQSFYEEVIEKYDSWQKALRENGINKKRLKERDKFYLYWILIKRYKKFGESSLRPKNIDQETKDKIVENYKTIKNLKRIIKMWDEEKVLYEVRARILTGEKIENLEQKEPKLYQQLLVHFDDIEAFYEEYYSRFMIETPIVTHELQEEKEKDEDEVINVEETTEETEDGKLQRMLIQLGEYTEEQTNMMIQASEKTKDEVIIYLMERMLQAKKNGEIPSDEAIKDENLVMYYAMRAYFGTFRQSLKEITSVFVAEA
jgi:hypothetical protein